MSSTQSAAIPASAFAPILAALITAAISAGVAWFTARRTVKLESEKLRLGAQQKILEVLVKARLDAYPRVYGLLSNLWKSPPAKSVSLAVLQDFMREFNEWDNAHSLLLGPTTTNVCYEFRELCNRALSELEPNDMDDKAFQEWAKNIFWAGQRLELALRSDIGIYGLQLNGPQGFQTPIPTRW